ncbi:MAG TPA: HAD family hydrolase [Puia sp.]|nr:HAD family hydrolase [Puia sp.]
MLDLSKADKHWTLFLDRDGVINREKEDDYVRHWSEFAFYEKVPESIQFLSEIFGIITVVTNQRGVGKGIMTEKDLDDIHRHMLHVLKKAGARIDHIYTCTSLDDNNPCRKPNPGMAFQAKKDFPQIDFLKSIMVGNKLSDMEFGRNAGMHTVFLKTTHPETPLPHPAIDMAFDSLADFAKAFH